MCAQIVRSTESSSALGNVTLEGALICMDLCVALEMLQPAKVLVAVHAAVGLLALAARQSAANARAG